MKCVNMFTSHKKPLVIFGLFLSNVICICNLCILVMFVNQFIGSLEKQANNYFSSHVCGYLME